MKDLKLLQIPLEEAVHWAFHVQIPVLVSEASLCNIMVHIRGSYKDLGYVVGLPRTWYSAKQYNEKIIFCKNNKSSSGHYFLLHLCGKDFVLVKFLFSKSQRIGAALASVVFCSIVWYPARHTLQPYTNSCL
jgi:hypothetical protein